MAENTPNPEEAPRPKTAVELGSVRGEPGNEYRVLRGRIRPVDLLGRRNETPIIVTRRERPEVNETENAAIESPTDASTQENEATGLTFEEAGRIATALLIDNYNRDPLSLPEGIRTWVGANLIDKSIEQRER